MKAEAEEEGVAELVEQTACLFKIVYENGCLYRESFVHSQVDNKFESAAWNGTGRHCLRKLAVYATDS